MYKRKVWHKRKHKLTLLERNRRKILISEKTHHVQYENISSKYKIKIFLKIIKQKLYLFFKKCYRKQKIFTKDHNFCVEYNPTLFSKEFNDQKNI